MPQGGGGGETNPKECFENTVFQSQTEKCGSHQRGEHISFNQLVSSVTFYMACDNKTHIKRISVERDVLSKHTTLLPESGKVQEGVN